MPSVSTDQRGGHQSQRPIQQKIVMLYKFQGKSISLNVFLTFCASGPDVATGKSLSPKKTRGSKQIVRPRKNYEANKTLVFRFSLQIRKCIEDVMSSGIQIPIEPEIGV